MDSRIRQLERAANCGDPEAQKLLDHINCRTFGHNWKTREEKISVFPLKYKTVKESCSRCGYIENPPKKKRNHPKSSAVEQLVHRYAYGNLEELQREYAKLFQTLP